ncbi:Branched-chain amino acid ABC transporter, ATP-binding protein LivF (TC 3.A.1.4.1) [Olavius sp. associated proteobacterium Delta 1]|nr:Branched-chain amino acid ABC transporter, ATP-binding protein LivF (TC 3.A.1.4.1) [Olavius sp. associated proteobacterium Delta 1]
MLSLENLSTFYGNFEAIKGISMSVEQGELVAVIGANGAGKTTLMRTICGLHKPKIGRIMFADIDITSLGPVERVKKGIVYCPEGRMLFPEMKVSDNLEMGAYTCIDDLKKNFDKVLALFPVLKDRKNQLAGSLSGGEQQMLAIGRSLMGNPKLILFDEPSTGLAPIIAEELMQVIKQLNDEGKTVVLVEQNVHLALEISQRGYIIENGKIVLEGDALALRENEEVKRAYLGG